MRSYLPNRLVVAVLAALLVAVACTSSDSEETTTTTTTAPPTTTSPTTTTETPLDPSDGLYVVLVWHQHQPLYPRNEDGHVTRPWTRVHATKDYYDMAALVAEYPDVRVTFNLTPVLMRQLEELTQGTKDVYWALTEMPAVELADEQRRFIIDRFFDTNARIVARFPRYQELIERRDRPESFSTDDVRDLQLLFNLAWTDPSFLTEEPLAGLVAKERNYTEEDKAVLLAEHERIIAGVLPLHAELWESGQIEVSTTPLAHPILPLIADTQLALVGDPTGVQPDNRFRQPLDAVNQVAFGLGEAERLLGRRPVGMWPGEGAVAQDVMGMFSSSGVEWVATGEDVLAKTLDIGSFTRDSSDLVEEAETLYKLYAADLSRQSDLPVLFRDVVLSDRIAFEYSGTPADDAAADFMARLGAINQALDAADVAGPKVVSVILDGENAWEHYENDGIDFLNALYTQLSNSGFVSTVTPSELLDLFPAAPEPLPDVFPASWFEPNFANWIGEPQEARAWDYLYRTRTDLGAAERSGEFDEEVLAEAYEAMLFAEGSDWFWWYGSDEESGDDGYFDAAFRELLGLVYDTIGEDRPAFTRIPIVPHPTVEPEYPLTDLVSIEIDNDVATSDWSQGGRYEFAGGELVGSLDYAFDKKDLFLRVGFLEEVLGDDIAAFDLYLGFPNPVDSYGLSKTGTVLGFEGTHRLSWSGSNPVILVGPIPHSARGSDVEARTPAGFDGKSIEFALPIETLPAVEAGDRINVRIIETTGGREAALLPSAGPGYLQVPDISDLEPVFEVADPQGDDHGPGSYVYPLDVLFVDGSYDLTNFSVGLSGGDTVVFSFDVDAPVANPWGSPAGYSIQTFDMYVDTDPGAGTGARLLLPGRNAALEDGNGWEYALTLEGWDPALYLADAEGKTEETKPTFKMIADPEGRVTARLPLELFDGGDPASWGYAVVLMSQEGFPSSGVRRVRDILPAAEQWRGGGAPDDVNHTRIFDLLHPEEGVQEDLLGNYEPADSLDGLGPNDFPRVPLIVPG
ncbi:MAG: glucodextranase DOMON-like domain-containing protein [Acidimicrobiia bacterium]|nr:glucodextranase DOMON-like domain-containing protein [Acidimicrobiia bacterium]